jgi:ABC-type sugar transport system permease subunit
MATDELLTGQEARHHAISARTRDRWTRYLSAYLMILPTFIFIGYFSYYPAYRALTGGFTRWDGFNEPTWIGLDNFRRAMDDFILETAIRNNLVFAFFDILFAIVPAFVVAALIFHLARDRAKYLFRSIFVVPIIVPGIVTILLWRYYYEGDGLINTILEMVGLEHLTRFWIGSPDTALYALALMGFPWISAFNMLIFYAGLQNISTEVMEAAELDGASGWRRLFTIEIPLVMSQFKLLLILAIINAGQNIVTPLVMTRGGPGYSTYTVSFYMYEIAVSYGDFGYSMAIALMLFVVILILTAIGQFLNREQW